jgi:hypothetical protein
MSAASVAGKNVDGKGSVKVLSPIQDWRGRFGLARSGFFYRAEPVVTTKLLSSPTWTRTTDMVINSPIFPLAAGFFRERIGPEWSHRRKNSGGEVGDKSALGLP